MTVNNSQPLGDGMVENSYVLKIVNKTNERQVYQVRLDAENAAHDFTLTLLKNYHCKPVSCTICLSASSATQISSSLAAHL